jgi:hypothetical protein
LIDRLLVLRLDVLDCEAEVLMNGVPIVRANAARPRAVVPVHEYTVAGINRFELVLWPRTAAAEQGEVAPPEPRVSNGRLAAHMRVLLPRVGNAADESSARTLAQLDSAPADGLAYEAPLVLSQEVSLPVSFPRWRWLDAPVVEAVAELRSPALNLLQQLAVSLSQGDADAFVMATRLRIEELAAAYQRDAADEAARLGAHLRELCADKRLDFLPMEPEGLVLRSVAGGRLLECLDATGAPMLRTAVDAAGRSVAFPLRLAAVEGRLYVLR